MLFYSLKPDGSMDGASLHTGCPVIRGVKWTATKWIHTLPFRPETMGAEAPEAMIYPEECKDAMHECPDWAKSGECEKNLQFMRGDAFTLGNCRASCGDCEVCQDDDIACKSRNRVKAGYLPMEDIM